METITINLYAYDELSEEAKAKALDNVRYSVAEFLNDSDASEYEATIKEIEDVFDINVISWEVGGPTHFRWQFKYGSRWCQETLCSQSMANHPKFLLRYLNYVEERCRRGKYYFKFGDGMDAHRRSKVLFEREYTLTGTWTSAPIDVMTGDKRWEFVKGGYTIAEYVYEVLDAFFSQWEKDREANFEDEVVIDHIEANEYQFLEDGTKYQ